MAMLRLRSLVLAMLLATTAPAGVAAGSFGVTPTRVQLLPEQRAAVVTLQNNAAEPVTVQVQTFAWPRTAAVGDLEPTRELLALPAVFTLPPGAKQIIRVALRAAPAGSTEAAYRLLITEVPGKTAGKADGVRFALRLSLPVFVTPTGAVPEPAWSTSGAGKKAKLQLVNHGSAHLSGCSASSSGHLAAPSRCRSSRTQPMFFQAGNRLGRSVLRRWVTKSYL